MAGAGALLTRQFDSFSRRILNKFQQERPDAGPEMPACESWRCPCSQAADPARFTRPPPCCRPIPRSVKNLKRVYVDEIVHRSLSCRVGARSCRPRCGRSSRKRDSASRRHGHVGRELRARHCRLHPVLRIAAWTTSHQYRRPECHELATHVEPGTFLLRRSGLQHIRSDERTVR
jgi:hypothetical protein